MKKLLLTVLLVGCVDAPIAGHVYSCKAVLTCDGKDHDISPSEACVDSEEDVDATYQARLKVILKDVKCTEMSVAPMCEQKGPCI